MSKFKPTPTPIPMSPGRVPVQSTRVGESGLFTFSFRFWKQTDYFGLGEQEPKWFVSLLEKLRELSKEVLDKFRSDAQARSYWRYHEIKWTQEGIPLQWSDLTWVDADYRDNTNEFPMYQFQVSASLGRVVGFWDERDVFNVVLLDPLHNIQPTKQFDYVVTPTTPLPCHYTNLLFQLREAQKAVCDNPNCHVTKSIARITEEMPRRRVLIFQMDDETAANAAAAFELGTAQSFAEIVSAGIEALYPSSIE